MLRATLALEAHAAEHNDQAASTTASYVQVRLLCEAAGSRYAELYHGDLVRRLQRLAEKTSLPLSLHEAGIPQEALPRLAEDAGTQWTGRFNPRTFDTAGALELYQMAY